VASVWLGNLQAIERRVHRDPNGDPATDESGVETHDRVPLDGERWTHIEPPAGLTLAELIGEITHPTRGIWVNHSDAGAPSWVASTDPAWATALAAVLGCPVADTPEGV
jgi:hypothetical protein